MITVGINNNSFTKSVAKKIKICRLLPIELMTLSNKLKGIQDLQK